MKEFIFGQNYTNSLKIKLENGKEIQLLLSKENQKQVKRELIRILVRLNLTEYLIESFEETIDNN